MPPYVAALLIAGLVFTAIDFAVAHASRGLSTHVPRRAVLDALKDSRNKPPEK